METTPLDQSQLQPADTLQSEVERARDRFRFRMEDLENFMFPVELQHPLSTGRMYIFAYSGPLDDQNRVRSGPRGARTLMDYELEEQCIQYEREDLIQVYLHRSRDMGMLSSKEQEMIIAQADGHLKKAKGKAMLPPVTLNELHHILKDVPRDANGLLCFHETQKAIIAFRDNRIKNYKLVYPNLGSDDAMNSTIRPKQKFIASKGRVPSSVANPFMFKRDQGYSNADLIKQTTEMLNKHAFKITTFESSSNPEIAYNMRLLREFEPKYDDPYVKKSSDKRVKSEWNSTSVLKGSAIGSMVQSVPSSSTWKRGFTNY